MCDFIIRKNTNRLIAKIMQLRGDHLTSEELGLIKELDQIMEKKGVIIIR